MERQRDLFMLTFHPLHDHPSPPSLTSALQYIQVIDNITHCSNLNYTLHDYDQENFIMYLTTVYVRTLKGSFEGCVHELCYHTTPVYLNITLLPCPPGFTLSGEPPVCNCYPVLIDTNVQSYMEQVFFHGMAHYG